MKRIMVRYKVKADQAAEIRDRCDEPPVATPLTDIGAYRFL